MASGWNLWVWLQCIGVASGCCCMRFNPGLNQFNELNGAGQLACLHMARMCGTAWV